MHPNPWQEASQNTTKYFVPSGKRHDRCTARRLFQSLEGRPLIVSQSDFFSVLVREVGGLAILDKFPMNLR